MRRTHVTIRLHPEIHKWLVDIEPSLTKHYPYLNSMGGVIEACIKQLNPGVFEHIEPGKYERDAKLNETKDKGNEQPTGN